ncbi:MAG: hypothetical protein ACYDCI_11810 [Candidatus Limnocylindrales bacterium]
MAQDNGVAVDQGADATDVVIGPVGSARLIDPASAGSLGADLDALTPIDGGSDPRVVVGGSIEGRTEPREPREGQGRSS